MALPAVVDRYAKFEISGGDLKSIARFADDGFEAVDLHERDHAEAIEFTDMDELIQLRRRQFAHGAEKAIVSRAHRQRAEIILQGFSIVRFDEPNQKRLAVGQMQGVGVLPQVLKSKRAHRKLPSVFRKSGRRPPWRQRRLWPRSRLPKRFFGLTDHVAPGKPDVMQVPLGPMAQLAALPPALAPDMQCLTDTGQKPDIMIIYHLFRWVGGHSHLLKITCDPHFLGNFGFPQTIICTTSDEINSCIERDE